MIIRSWRSVVKVLVVALWAALAAGCVYYNTFFNAKKKFELAEKQIPPAAASAGPSRFSAGYRGYDEAIERFSRIIERYPKSKWVDDAYYYIGISYFRMGEYDKAQRALREILNTFPKSKYAEECSLWLAVCRVRSGETLSGQELLYKIAREAQKKRWRAAAWYELGELFLEDKEYDSAAVAFLTVADEYSSEENGTQARFQAGEAFRLAGQQDRALEQFHLTMRKELTPELAYQTHIRMADAYLGRGQIDSGLALLQTLAADTRYADSLGVLWLKIGGGLEQDQQYDEAIQTYEGVIEKFPKTAWSAEAYYHLGYIEQKVHFDFVAARDFYQKAKDEFARSEFAQKAVELSVTLATIEGYREQISPKKAAAGSSDARKILHSGASPDSGTVGTRQFHPPLLEDIDSTALVDTVKSGWTINPIPPLKVADSSSSSAAQPVDSLSGSKDTTTAGLLHPVGPPRIAGEGPATPPAPQVTDTSASSSAAPPADSLSGSKDATTAAPSNSVGASMLTQEGLATPAVPDSGSAPDLDTTRVFDVVIAMDTILVIDTTRTFDTMRIGDPLVLVDTTTATDTTGASHSPLVADTAVTADTTGAGLTRFVVDTTMAFDSTFIVDTLITYDTTLVFDTAAVIQAEKAAQIQKAAQKQREEEEAKLATAYFKLAEAFHTILDAPDSALCYYDSLVARFPTSADVPRALFASASILENNFHDSAAAAERYRKVLAGYGHSDFAGEAIRHLGLSGTPADTGYPEAAYRQAERALLEGGRAESVRVMFDRVVKTYPGSLYAPMAAYAGAVVAEEAHKKEDSTVLFLYQRVVDSFPETPFAAAAKVRMGEGTTKRKERVRVVAAETPQTQKVDSALAAIKAEQADTTIIRLPRARRPQKAGEFVYPQSEMGSEPWKGSVLFKILIDLTGRIADHEMVMPSKHTDIDLSAEAAIKETFFDADSIPPESLNMWYLYEVKVIPPAQKPENIFNDPLWKTP